ncbi:hypothetical protein ACJMK2_031780 [Sinanodonta woodiana]|uniref:RING-type domain-containing protein n=1 Tax=Sinanodonta woodiana TaxID=1069815 RepID=A0ABD3WZT3_SINWO
MASKEQTNQNNSFVCSICQQCLREPKELSCKHVVCRDCIHNYILNNARDYGFDCPCCQKMIQVADTSRPLAEWVDNIPTSYELIHKLQKMNVDEGDLCLKFCEICSGNLYDVKATKHCIKCNSFFCDECGDIHGLLNGSKEHILAFLDRNEDFKSDPLLSCELNALFNVRRNISKICSSGDNVMMPGENVPDKVRCLVTGACFLDDGCVVIVDRGNRKLKLFDACYHFLIAISIDAYDVVNLGHFLVALTCPNEKRMRFYNLHEHEFIETGDIETEDMCYGLCLMNDKIAVGCVGSVPNLKIVDNNGGLRTIRIRSGTLTFKVPYYITYHSSKNYFYVSDAESKCVKCLEADGNIVWERHIKDARGLSICCDYLLMARQEQCTVDIVNNEGQYLKSIISMKDGVHKPHAISVRSADDRILLLLSDDTDLVSVFTLENPMLKQAVNEYQHNIIKTSDPSITSHLTNSKKTMLCSIL